MMNNDILKAVMEAADKKEKSASLIVGRFNPFHIGHANAIKMMAYTPVICIIKGKKSSENKEQNPLDEDYQAKLIKKVFPNVKVIVAEKAFIPAIVGQIKEMFGLEVKEILGGKDKSKNEDRLTSYRNQIESANRANAKATLDPKKEQFPQIKIEKYTEAPRLTSATKVRAAIRSGDKTAFLKLIPAQLHSEWPKMREIFADLKEADFVIGRILLEENNLITVLNHGAGGKVYIYRIDEEEFEVEDHGKKIKVSGISKLKEFIAKFIDELGYKPGYSFK